MEELSIALQEFFSQFANAYQEGNVPTGTSFPYISYQVIRPDYLERTMLSINIYDKSTSFARLRGIDSAIEKAVPHSGAEIDLPNDMGKLLIYRGAPFIQNRSLPEDEVREFIKADYVNFEVVSHIL